jgi:hypothetical protein
VAGVYLSEAQNPIPPSLLHTVHVYIYCTVLIHTGKEGREEKLTREKVRGATVHKAESKIPA